MSYDLQKRAKLRCMHLLEKRDYTEKELREKLSNGKTDYSAEDIDAALEYVKSFRYVDDARYAEKYIECMSARKSKRQIELDLYRKGVDRSYVEQAFAEAEEVDEEQQIIHWMEKKRFDPENSDVKDRQRMYAFLMRKGFQSDDISRAMRIEFG